MPNNFYQPNPRWKQWNQSMNFGMPMAAPPQAPQGGAKLSVSQMMGMQNRGGPNMSLLTDAKTGQRLSNQESENRGGFFSPGWNTGGMGHRGGGYGGGYSGGYQRPHEPTGRPEGEVRGAKTSADYYAKRDQMNGNPLDNIWMGNRDNMAKLTAAMEQEAGGPLADQGSNAFAASKAQENSVFGPNAIPQPNFMPPPTPTTIAPNSDAFTQSYAQTHPEQFPTETPDLPVGIGEDPTPMQFMRGTQNPYGPPVKWSAPPEMITGAQSMMNSIDSTGAKAGRAVEDFSQWSNPWNIARRMAGGVRDWWSKKNVPYTP